jgi:Ribonuclease G/E
VNALKELLFAELPDVICIPGPAELGAIYLGIVHKRRAWGYEIDLGDLKGFLPKPELDRPLKKGEAVRVQVKEIVHPQPIVTTKLSLAGRFAVFSQEQGVGISKEITDTEERERALPFRAEILRQRLGSDLAHQRLSERYSRSPRRDPASPPTAPHA